jgi:hypothetical protein
MIGFKDLNKAVIERPIGHGVAVRQFSHARRIACAGRLLHQPTAGAKPPSGGWGGLKK